MTRTITVLLFLALCCGAVGCASLSSSRPRDDHRMQPYVPNVSANPAGIPAVVAREDVPALEGGGIVESRRYHLSPGDDIITQLLGIPRPQEIRQAVDSKGNITLPLVGQLPVAGLTTSEAERLIERTYVERGIFRNINVIMVSEDKSYFVQGEVNRQGRFPLAGEVTLLKAISESGGYSPFANRRNVKVIRGDDVLFFNARRIASGRDPDPLIQANDIIEVLRSVFF